jgi:hypothetical protein
MRKRVQIALAVVVAAGLAVVGWQVLRPQEREAVYQGKRLSVWLRNSSGTHNNRLRRLTCALSVAWRRPPKCEQKRYFFTCPETSFVISNMLTCVLPLNTAFRFSSALMRVLFFASCNPFVRM